MANVGYATLQIIPSVRGIGDELRAQLVGPAAASGGEAGEEAGGGFKEAFQGALAAIGIAEVASKIGEQFTEAFNLAIEQANVTSTLQAQLGASTKDAAKYGGEVGRLYANAVTDDIQQGAEAIRGVVSGGLIPPGATIKQLDSISVKMIDVANTFGTDMGLQTQAVSALLKNGLAPSASEALDVITTGFQKLGPNAEDLLETFQEYPVQLKKLGLDANTALGLFSQGLQGGARDTDIIADSLKEFSIRSIDMSDTSKSAYKQLGLSAKDMSLQISKGGAGATAGLQTVLDKLRGIKDPVARNAAAVGLFGTQAEDLGTALFKLDPSKASKAFGDVSGAAGKLGEDLRSGPSYEITLFKRTLQQGLVTFIGGKVLPILAKWGATFNSEVLPPLTKVGGTLNALFLPTLAKIGSAIGATISWFKEWGIWLAPLAILIGGVTLALSANAIMTGIVTAVFSVYKAAMIVGQVVTGGFAAAQAALNAVMALNPFVLIAIALVALVALIVIAWKNSDTFRAVVMAAWQGIQTAASYAWNSILKPAFAGFMTGLHAIGDAALWLWNNAISPAFSFISTAARILATIITIVVGGPIYLLFLLLGATAKWLWANAIKPAFDAIAAAAIWLYNTVIKPNIALAVLTFHALGAAGTWLWNNAIKPAFNGIAALGKWLWNTVIKPTFNYFMAGIRTLGAVGTWLWKNSIQPAFNGIRSIISTVWNSGIKPVFAAVKTAVGLVGVAFGKAKDAISSAWSKLSAIAKKPISYIVDVVYNKGIVGVWNKVAGAFGAPKLSKFAGFAAGGAVHGPGTETSDSVLSRLSRNEHVWTAREVRGAGGHGAVMAMRQQAAAGQLAMPGFKDGGGLFGWIGAAGSALKGAGSAAWNGIKKGASWLKDTLAASARAGVNSVVNPLLSHIPGLGTGIGNMISKIPKKMIDSIFGYADKSDAKGASSVAAGPGALGKWISQAMGLTKVPASWAGPLRTLIMRESGGNPKAINLTDSNAKAGHPSQGLMQTIPGTFSAYRLKSLPNDITNPVANIVAGIRYILSRYGSIFNVQQAVGSTPKGYDAGGWLMPGVTMAVNKTGQPEAILTAPQWQAMAAQAAAAKVAVGASASRASASGMEQSGFEGLSVRVFVGSEELSHIARAEVHRANGELVQVLNAGGGS